MLYSFCGHMAEEMKNHETFLGGKFRDLGSCCFLSDCVDKTSNNITYLIKMAAIRRKYPPVLRKLLDSQDEEDA